LFRDYTLALAPHSLAACCPKEPWNKNKLIEQQSPLKLQQIWVIHISNYLFDNFGSKMAKFDLLKALIFNRIKILK
jgi:hypothetical protein